MSVQELADRILKHLAQHYTEHGVSKFDTKSLAGYVETDQETTHQALQCLHDDGHVELHLDGSAHITDKGIQSCSE